MNEPRTILSLVGPEIRAGITVGIVLALFGFHGVLALVLVDALALVVGAVAGKVASC